MKQVLFLFVLLMSITSCKKFVTTNKVNRVLQLDSWRISGFVHQDNNLTDSFNGVTFVFGESSKLSSSEGLDGKWTVNDTKPTKLYLSGYYQGDGIFFYLVDDWLVKECSKNEVVLTAESGSFTNQITFRRILQD
jgi:hypothetical protein